MQLKPAFNCNRSWIYRFKSGENEITYALRFKKSDLADKFKEHFENDVKSLVEAAEKAAAPVEEVAQTEEKQEESAPVVEQAAEQTEQKTEEAPAAVEQVQ